MGVKTISNECGADILSAIAQNDLKRLKDVLEKRLKTDDKIREVCQTGLRHRQTKTVAVPLMLAVRLRDPSILRYMLERGVNPNFMHMRSTGSTSGRREVMTPLHVAVDLANYDVVDVLLAARADCNVRDHNGDTPLHIAVQKADTVLTRTLLLRGADVNSPDRAGNTSLHTAARLGHRGLVAILIQYGADVNRRGVDAALPLQIAAREGHADLLALFRTADGAPVDTTLDCFGDEREVSALHLAAAGGHHEAVCKLIDHLGAGVDVVDGRGNTALHCVVLVPYNPRRMRSRDSFRSTAQALLDRRANPNVRNTYGDTALHLAVVNGFSKVVQLLLERGACCQVENLERLKPIHLVHRDDHITRQLLRIAATKTVTSANAQQMTSHADLNLSSAAHLQAEAGSQHSCVDFAGDQPGGLARRRKSARARSKSAEALDRLHRSRVSSRSVRCQTSESSADVIMTSSVTSSGRRSRRKKKQQQQQKIEHSLEKVDSEQDTTYDTIKTFEPEGTSSRQSRPRTAEILSSSKQLYRRDKRYHSSYANDQSYAKVDDFLAEENDSNFRNRRRHENLQSASWDRLDKLPTKLTSRTRSRSLSGPELSTRKKEKKKLAAAEMEREPEVEDDLTSLSTVTTPTSELQSDNDWPREGRIKRGGKTVPTSPNRTAALHYVNGQPTLRDDSPFTRLHSISGQQSRDNYYVTDVIPATSQVQGKVRSRKKGTGSTARDLAAPSDEQQLEISFPEKVRVSSVSSPHEPLPVRDFRLGNIDARERAAEGVQLYSSVQKPNTIGIHYGGHSITISVDPKNQEPSTSLNDRASENSTENKAGISTRGTAGIEVGCQRSNGGRMYQAERPVIDESISVDSVLEAIGLGGDDALPTPPESTKGRRTKKKKTTPAEGLGFAPRRGVVEKELRKYSESDVPTRQRPERMDHLNESLTSIDNPETRDDCRVAVAEHAQNS